VLLLRGNAGREGRHGTLGTAEHGVFVAEVSADAGVAAGIRVHP